jgi:hypothetical protein
MHHEGVWGSGCTYPRSFDLAYYLELSCELHTVAALSTGKEPPVPIVIGVRGWAPEPVWTLWWTVKSFTTGTRTLTVQPITSRY